MKTTDIGFERFEEDFYTDPKTMFIKPNKEKPIKIGFIYHTRGFYCPTCLTSVKNKDQKCMYCGQQLLETNNIGVLDCSHMTDEEIETHSKMLKENSISTGVNIFDL